MQFINCCISEWRKKKRSLASWLVIIGAFFTPLIILIARLIHHTTIAKLNAAPEFWENIWRMSWESMAIFLLPLGTVMATSLITQLEYKNNAWKQLHSTAQTFTALFFAKLLIIAMMLFQFIWLFTVGIFLAGYLPGLLTGNKLPAAPVPFLFFAKENMRYFLEAMPLMTAQYALGVRFKNFLVPLGAGIIGWILSIGMLNWQWGWLFPYSFCPVHYLKANGRMMTKINVDLVAAAYFILFTFVGFSMYISRKEKG